MSVDPICLQPRYTVELMTLPPKPQQTLTLTCVVRQANKQA